MAPKRLKSQMKRYNLFCREVFRKTKSQENVLLRNYFSLWEARVSGKDRNTALPNISRKLLYKKPQIFEEKNMYGILDL